MAVVIIANTAAGQPVGNAAFGRMQKPWASFSPEAGKLATATRIDVGAPALARVEKPLSASVTPERWKANASRIGGTA